MTDTWLDLSDYGLQLLLVKSAKGHYLVVFGNGAIDHLGRLKPLMFRDVPRRTEIVMADVTLLNDGTIPRDRHPTLDRWKAAFPNAREVAYDHAAHYRDNSVQPAQVSNAPATMAMPAKPIGMNKAGQEVVADARGTRWAKDDKGAYFAEGSSGVGMSDPAIFLRAHRNDVVEQNLLALCAEGFCEQGYKGSTLREEDLSRFLATTHPGPVAPGTPAYRAARDAIEAASARLTHRKGRNSLAAAYNAAIKFHDRLAFLSDGQGPGTRGMPGPLGIVAQGLLGTEATLRGKRILVHNPGLGHAFSGLPGVCDLSFSGQVDAEGTRRMLAVNGLRAKAAAPGDAYDVQIMDLRAAPGSAVTTPAGPLTRADLAEALAILSSRDADGNTAIVIDGASDDGERQEIAAFKDHLSQEYALDAEAVVDGAVWAGTDAVPPKHVLSVGWRRPERDTKALPPIPRTVSDWGALFKWRSDVISGRTAMPVAAPTEAAANFNSGAKVKGSEFQVPYVSASRNGTPRTMVPRNLEGATRTALARTMRRRGDIDAFVATEYGYTREELAELFSPEQVDALALRVEAEERGRGFLLADQTGVGKGRTLAASIRRSILRGQRVLFLTERQTNLSDIMRDLRHTRSLDLLRYRIINDGVQIINEDTKEVDRRSDPREEVDAMLASGRWPDDGTNLIIGTYSQFSANLSSPSQEPGLPAEDAAGVRAAKSKWLVTAIDERCDVHADECHNAASHTANVSKNLSAALARSTSPVFSSSTFAHKGSHMAFYASLLPDGVTSEELSHMLDKGGETFQEVLSWMLVQDGVMIRREFDLSELVIETVTDTSRIERNRDCMDAIAPVLSEFAALDDLAGARVATLNAMAREGAAPEPGEPPRRGRRPRGGARPKGPRNPFTRVGHGSSRYTITRLFLSSLKVDMTVDLALASLRNDEKPVIFVENTVESLLAEVGDDPERDDAGLGPDIRTLFRKVLRQSVTAKDRTGGTEQKQDLREGSEAITAAHDRILEMIERIPALPLSAIDEIKRRIEEAGFTCGEITGRSLEVVDGKVVRRAVPNPTVVKNDFNSGHLDAVIINNSGATGVDLHAGSRFADQRRRHMIEHQIPSDVVKASQGRGRTNRFDQVVPPRYTTPLAGLPAEVRLAAMDNARMRRLSATTTSNRHAAALSQGIPDLINPVGDTVCEDYARKRPDLMRRLGFKVSEIEENTLKNQRQELATQDELKEFVSKKRKANSVGDDSAKVADSHRTANEILSRMIMLPVSLQEKVCAELTAEFHAAIEELEAKGDTPLKTQELAGIVHPRTKGGVIEQQAFEGAEVEDPDSVFDEPLYICEAALERVAKAMKGDEIVQLVEMGETASGRKQQCLDRLANGMEEILQTYLPENMPSVQVALEANDERMHEQKRHVERLIEALASLSPGCEVTYTVDGDRTTGVVTGISYPERGMEHVAGSYGVDFVVPGDPKPRSMRLRTLMRDPAFEVGPGLSSERCDGILKDFDDAVHMTVSSVKLLRNNPFRALRLAVTHGVGSLKMYRLADGTMEKGVVVSKRMHDLGAIPVAIEGWEMAVAALGHGYELIGDSKGSDKLLTMRSPDGKSLVLKLPPPASRRFGHIYDDATIKNLAGQVDPDSKGAVLVTVNMGEMKAIMNGLKATGTGLWTTSLARNWAKDYLRDNQRRVEAEAPRLAMA